MFFSLPLLRTWASSCVQSPLWCLRLTIFPRCFKVNALETEPFKKKSSERHFKLLTLLLHCLCVLGLWLCRIQSRIWVFHWMGSVRVRSRQTTPLTGVRTLSLLFHADPDEFCKIETFWFSFRAFLQCCFYFFFSARCPRNCKDDTELLFARDPVNGLHLSQIRQPYPHITVNYPPHLMCCFTSVLPNVPLSPSIAPRIPHCIWLSCVLKSPLVCDTCMTLFFMSFIAWSYHVKRPPVGVWELF